MFQMCGVFAQFERSMIVSPRQRRAQACPRQWQDPRLRQGLLLMLASVLAAILGRPDKGTLKIAAQFGVGSGTVQHQGGDGDGGTPGDLQRHPQTNPRRTLGNVGNSSAERRTQAAFTSRCQPRKTCATSGSANVHAGIDV